MGHSTGKVRGFIGQLTYKTYGEILGLSNCMLTALILAAGIWGTVILFIQSWVDTLSILGAVLVIIGVAIGFIVTYTLLFFTVLHLTQAVINRWCE